MSDLSKENQELLAENERLKQEKMRLQLEYDLLNAASEVIKKGQGISLPVIRRIAEQIKTVMLQR